MRLNIYHSFPRQLLFTFVSERLKAFRNCSRLVSLDLPEAARCCRMRRLSEFTLICGQRISICAYLCTGLYQSGCVYLFPLNYPPSNHKKKYIVRDYWYSAPGVALVTAVLLELTQLSNADTPKFKRYVTVRNNGTRIPAVLPPCPH